MSLRFRIVKTAAGYAGFVVGARGLRRVFMPFASSSVVQREIAACYPDAAEDDALLPDVADGLCRFFAGEPVEFAGVRFDWSDGGRFEVEVWRACREIRYGQTKSYQDLAERVGRPGGARAVGMAMSRNPFAPIVPCHRVVKSDGSLGGYSGPGGVAFKRRLLEMEAAVQAAPV